MAAYFFGREAEVVNAKFVNCPSEAFEDHVAGDVADLFGIGVPKGVDGGVRCCVGQIKDPFDYACPDVNRILDCISVFVLGDVFVIVVIFLVDEGDGYGGGGVVHLSVCYFFVSVTEYDCLWGDNLGFLCAVRLRILI